MIGLWLSIPACAPKFDDVQQKAWVDGCIDRKQAICARVSDEWLEFSRNSRSRIIVFDTRCTTFWTPGACLTAGKAFEERSVEQERKGWLSITSRRNALRMYRSGCKSNPGNNLVCQSYQRLSDENLVDYPGKWAKPHEAEMEELKRLLSD